MEDLISMTMYKVRQYTNDVEEIYKNIIQDYFVTINIGKWESTKSQQYPSVLHQMCSAAARYKNILEENYYYPLFIDTDDTININEIMTNHITGTDTPAPPLRANPNNNNFNVDVIDLAQLDDLIAQQHIQDELNDENEDDEIMEPEPTQNANRHTTMHVYRVELRRLYGVKTPGISRGEALKSFYVAMKHEDPLAAIRPFYSGDADRIPSITSATQVQKPEHIDVQRYHQGFVTNQKFGITGKLVIESALSFDALEIALSGWLHKNYYQMSLSDCQTAELVTIGMLLHASYTMSRNEFNANLKGIIQNKPENERFEVSVRKDKWFFSAGSIDVLFVAVDRPNVIKGTNFFSELYDGENKKVPMGVPLWFIPTYQIDISDETREKIGQEQRTWRSNEAACFVQGFKDLSTIVTLSDGAQCSIRNLLLRFPTGTQGHPRRTLFHSVDRDEIHEGWIIVTYHKDDTTLFKRRSSNLAYEINQLLAPGEDKRVFINPTVGITFGGEITKTYSAKYQKGRQRAPTPVSPGIITHFQSMIGKMQNVAIKRPQLPTIVTPAPQRQRSNSSSTLHQSYAASASAAMYTSTTRTSDSTKSGRQDTVQTTTSVTVIEQHEQRFVRIETMCHDNAMRITRMERTTGRTNNMIKALLQHSGITVEDEVDESQSDQMEIEQMRSTQGNSIEGGNKRIRQDTNHSEITGGDNNSQNASQA